MVARAQAMLDAKAALAAAMADAGVTGLSDSAIALLLGQAFGESFFGRAVDGYGQDMAGTNNWGSVQFTGAWGDKHANDEGYGKFAHVDTHADGTPYVAWFRIYPHQKAGAQGFLATVGGASSTLAAALEGGPASYAAYLKGRGYYEAPEDQYATMLTNDQALVMRDLGAAASQSLTAADPTDTSETGGIASVADRFKRATSLVASVSPASGVVWFGDGFSPNEGTAWPLGPIVVGVVFGLLTLAGWAAWKGHVGT